MKITELRNQDINVEHHTPDNGQPEMWRLMFTDKQTGDVIWVSFPSPVRDTLVRHLTGGGVVVPQMVVPRGKPR